MVAERINVVKRIFLFGFLLLLGGTFACSNTHCIISLVLKAMDQEREAV